MPRYVLCFGKEGLIKYTSHLDMLRLFKRTFKSCDIPLEYSQGFNPHPKMGFAQPLSLGYTAEEEFLEFHTYREFDLDKALTDLKSSLPKGITIKYLEPLNITASSLASVAQAALYKVDLPINYESRHEDIIGKVNDFLDEKEIMGEKRDKKTKKMVEKDIRPMIRDIKVVSHDGNISLLMLLDCGSKSNLSPETVISAFGKYGKLYLPREEIEITRKYIFFDACFPQRKGLE